MAYQVSDTTKKLTTKCSNNFSCLNNDSWNPCSIERELTKSLLVIKKKNDKSTCPYCFPYGFSYYCTCLPDVKSTNVTIYEYQI